MKITSFKIFRYSLPLIRPLVFNGYKIITRQGLILKLVFNGNTPGWGEVAPLPGFSCALVGECLENLRHIRPVLLKENFSCLEDEAFARLDKINMYPEVRFGVEAAILNALAIQKQMPLSKFLSADAAEKVILNGLLPEPGDSLEAQTRRLLQKGYNLIKIKVEGNVEEDIKRVTAVADAAKGRAQLRVDANQKWDFEGAVLFARKLAERGIQYIEEPFSDISRIPEFFRKTAMAVALDESLVSRGFDFVSKIEGVKFLVFKPTLSGGIRKVFTAVCDARIRGLKSVISSSFESGIGMLTLAHLAGACGEDVSAGLDTLKWFKNELLKEPPFVCEGKLSLSEKNISESDIHGEFLTLTQ